MGLATFLKTLVGVPKPTVEDEDGRLSCFDATEDFVDEDKALRLSAVYRCLDIKSGATASIPITVYEKVGGGYVAIDDHELTPLLSLQPNGRQTIFEMMQQVVLQIDLRGNAYIFIRRGRRGEVKGLYLASADTVTYDARRGSYRVNDYMNDLKGTFDYRDVIHFKNTFRGVDGLGISTIEYAARVLSLGVASDKETLVTIANGGQSRGLLTSADGGAGFGSPPEGTKRSIADRLNSDLADRTKRVAYLPADLKYIQLGLSPLDTQLLEIRKFSPMEICRFFGVHPNKIFASQSSNYKDSENSQVSFLTDTLQPLLRQFEMELKSKLIPKPLQYKYKISFDLADYYKADPETKSRYYKTMLEIGALTINEIRAREGMAKIEGGDTLLVSCNVAPISNLKSRVEDNTNKEEEEHEGIRN